MTVAPIGSPAANLINILPVAPGQGATPAAEGPGFGQMVSEAIEKLDQLQQQANSASIDVASGDSADLHSALMKVEEAGLALQLSLQVRNKLVESYQEIMRMPV